MAAQPDDTVRTPVSALSTRTVSVSERFLSASPRLAAALVAPGQHVASYTIQKLIAEGGMGSVFEAQQAHPRRQVALKLIRPEHVSPDTLARFTVECELLGRLQHPGIARIYEAGTALTALGEQPFFTMELVSGLRLDEHIAQARASIRQRLELVIKVAEAVHHAHLHGVVHCDLKPSNVLIDRDGEPKVVDFGVALLTAETSEQDPLVVSGVGGTPCYMSPEQLAHDLPNIDARSDVYTLGAITFELLTGRLHRAMALGNAAVPRSAHKAVSDGLRALPWAIRGNLNGIISKALEEDRAQRYQSAREFADDLKRVIGGFPTSARVQSFWPKAARWATREEHIRQAGLATLTMNLAWCLFHSYYAMVGIAELAGWAAIPPGTREPEFTLVMILVVAVLAVMAWFSVGMMRNHRWSMWASLVGGGLLFIFSLVVAANIVSYDAAGSLSASERDTLFVLFSLFALVIILLSGLGLTTHYLLNQWEKPVG